MPDEYLQQKFTNTLFKRPQGPLIALVAPDGIPSRKLPVKISHSTGISIAPAVIEIVVIRDVRVNPENAESSSFGCSCEAGLTITDVVVIEAFNWPLKQ